MVLGQHRVSRVRAAVVSEDDMLLILAALNDLGRSGSQLILDLVDDRNNKGSNHGEDKNRKLLLQLFNDLGQDRNLLNSTGDALEDLVVQLNGGHDLLEYLLDVACILLRVPGRDAHVLKLGIIRVTLDVMDLLLLVAFTEDAARDLVQKVLQNAGVAVPTVLEGALELLDLVLGQFVRHLARHGV